MIDFTGKKILITGGSGFVGHALTKRLLQEKVRVTSMCKDCEKLEGLTGRAELVTVSCDLTDKEIVSDIVHDAQPDIVFHMASKPDSKESYEHIDAIIDANIKGTLNLLEAFSSVAGGVLVFGDSSKSYGNTGVPHSEENREEPTSSYAISKVAGWSFCRLYSQLHHFSAVSVRPTLIYGPGQGFNLFSFLVQNIEKGVEEIVLSGGQQTRDPLYIDDAVKAYLWAAQEQLNGQVLNIGGGREYSVKELAELLVAISGSDIPVRSCATEMRPTEILRSFCDNRTMKRLTGWQPETTLVEGLKNTYEYLSGQIS